MEEIAEIWMKDTLSKLSEVLGFSLLDFQEVLDNSCTGSTHKTLEEAKKDRDNLNWLCFNVYDLDRHYDVYKRSGEKDFRFCVMTKEEFEKFNDPEQGHLYIKIE